jgi:hypothetical protein
MIEHYAFGWATDRPLLRHTPLVHSNAQQTAALLSCGSDCEETMLDGLTAYSFSSLFRRTALASEQ